MELYMLPFVQGTEVGVTQGNNSPYSHYGRAAYAFDFSLGVQDEGTMLVAAASGTVALVRQDTPDHECGGEELAGRGNYLVIEHDDGFCDLYHHLQYGSVADMGLTIGDSVARGQPIARMGKTGYTGCRAHLHFQRQYCGPTYWQQSVPVVFGDVPGDGVPKEGQRYISGNEVARPASLHEALRRLTAEQTGRQLRPGQAFLAYAQRNGLGCPLSTVTILTAPDGHLYAVQVFEGDTLFVRAPQGDEPVLGPDIQTMRTLLLQDRNDPWGMALWQHTYACAGIEFRPTWASHAYALDQLAGNPLGAPLGGGSANGVHTLNVDGKEYEVEVYAWDTIYWMPTKWADIRRLREWQA